MRALICQSANEAAEGTYATILEASLGIQRAHSPPSLPVTRQSAYAEPTGAVARWCEKEGNKNWRRVGAHGSLLQQGWLRVTDAARMPFKHPQLRAGAGMASGSA